MDNNTNDCSSINSDSRMKNGRACCDEDERPSSAPALLMWIWNWFANLPKTLTNLYADLKSGELLHKFTLLDAMGQFILAVATSCHPQEDPEEEPKNVPDASNSSKAQDIKVFGGAGRSLRSRTVPST